MNNRRKGMIVSIASVIVIILLVSGVTYAYIASATNESNVNTGSGKLDINYVKPSDITGRLSASSTRNNGLKASASASLNTGSVDALFNMYITPTSLTNLNIPALKWEAEGIRGGSVVCSRSGNFSSATVGTKIKVIDSCTLSTTVTTFNVYIWLDSSLITSAISDASFGAKISVDSVPITGNF